MSNEPVRPGGIWRSVNVEIEVQVVRTNAMSTVFMYLDGPLAGNEGSMTTVAFLRMYVERDLLDEQTPKVIPGQTWWTRRTQDVFVLSVLNGVVTFRYPSSHEKSLGFGAMWVEDFLKDYTLDGPPEPVEGAVWRHSRGGEHTIVAVINDGDQVVVVHRDNISSHGYIASRKSDFIEWFDAIPQSTNIQPGRLT
jgi:hypothetical protein